MKTVIHKADSRGYADHGWLQSYHSFSFANYHNPERMNFGALRVLNDDTVAGGKGFGKHPHRNMEIISIPLEGALKHEDNMGNSSVIKKGDVQVMSAGRGVVHSEFNDSREEAVKFLQIWIFPDKKGVEARYDQIQIEDELIRNEFYQIVSPNKEDQGVWIHQQAWLHLAELEEGIDNTYKLKKANNNGVYFFLINGELELAGDILLEKRDAVGIWNTDQVEVKAKEKSKVLLIEVPMDIEH
jgi:hypothetical protein